MKNKQFKNGEILKFKDVTGYQVMFLKKVNNKLNEKKRIYVMIINNNNNKYVHKYKIYNILPEFLS